MGAEKKKYESMDLVFTILQRGKGEKVIKVAHEQGAGFNIIYPGRGTATSSILEIMGLGATEKDVVLSFCKSEISPKLIEAIAENRHFDKAGTGISFSVPLQSVAGARVLRFLQSDTDTMMGGGFNG